jgi:hypothetical protein
MGIVPRQRSDGAQVAPWQERLGALEVYVLESKRGMNIKGWSESEGHLYIYIHALVFMNCYIARLRTMPDSNNGGPEIVS